MISHKYMILLCVILSVTIIGILLLVSSTVSIGGWIRQRRSWCAQGDYISAKCYHELDMLIVQGLIIISFIVLGLLLYRLVNRLP